MGYKAIISVADKVCLGPAGYLEKGRHAGDLKISYLYVPCPAGL
jgi:hypothetical protein